MKALFSPSMTARRLLSAAALTFASLSVAGCVTPVGPVEVTRFHGRDIARLGSGTIRVVPAVDQADTLEFRTYAAAIEHELTKYGYRQSLPNETRSDQVAVLSLDRQTLAAQSSRNPVSVGMGGGAGSYGSGVGLGIGINLSGKPKDQLATRVFVAIRDAQSSPSASALWEGRAAFIVQANSPLAQAPLGAAKVAEALFADFPGKSGETVQVK